MQLSRVHILKHLQDALLGFVVIVRMADVFQNIPTELLYHFVRVTIYSEEHGWVVVTGEAVDVDADEDADFADIPQFFTQLEVAAGTKIANHDVKDVEVGHCGGDAVELVHQPRLDIVEKLGAHRLGVWSASPFELSQKRIRELLSEWRLWTAYIPKRESPRITP